MQTSPPEQSCSTDSAGQMLTSIEDLSRAYRNRLTPAGVESGMHYLLRTLARSGPARVTELAARAHLDTSTVSRHVQNLERHGYVGRTQDPLDGRAYRLELSPSGRDLLDRLHHDPVEALQCLIGDWTTDEVEQLDRFPDPTGPRPARRRRRTGPGAPAPRLRPSPNSA